MDALNASASSKKEPKKRKRRPSVNKESVNSPPQSPLTSVTTPTTPTSPSTTNSLNLKSITPANFYQDTLESNNEIEESEKVDEDDNMAMDNNDKEVISESTKTDSNGLKGVLLYAKKKGPKKSIKWKPESDLVTVQYFELDETERVNVTRTFMDLAKMEMSGERDALQKSRKLNNEDTMDIQTNWRLLIEIDLKPPLAEPGCKSLEKDIQFAREKSVLQALFFGGRMVSDSPIEPDLETHQMTDPLIIPLEDPENPETEATVSPWPDPKGSPPQTPIQNMPPIFTNPYPNFGMGGGPPPPFQNIPFVTPAANFMQTNLLGAGTDNWNSGPRIPHNMPPPDLMNQNGPMPGTTLFPNADFNPNMNDNPNFPPPFNQNAGMGGMFPNNFHMNRGRGGGGGGGGFRGRGMVNGPWIRMNGPGPGWNPNRGNNNMNRGGGGGGRICKNIKNHGYCRNRDSCSFYHPN